MKLLATSLAAAAAVGLADAAAWSMTSWTGQACGGGKVGTWAVGPDTKSCITFANVLSLNVSNGGPCTTYYYHDSACQTSPFLGTIGVCNGFNGQPVGSFRVNCTG